MRKQFTIIENHKLTLLPPFEHKEPVDDDCGLPEHPIYSNFSKYLWTSHTRTGGRRPSEMPRENGDRTKI
jgi:hypothetical protein